MSVETKYGEAIMKQTQEMAEMFKAAMPKINTNKNGYEIRTQVLEMAKSFTEFEYSNKWMGWETTSKRDPQSGEIVSKVGMPQIPTTDHILEAAERFYDFVNGKPSK